MRIRLDTGRWGNITQPQEMNRVAASFGIDASAFVDHRLEQFDRPFYPDSNYPGAPLPSVAADRSRASVRSSSN
jgi:hypothetical protein